MAGASRSKVTPSVANPIEDQIQEGKAPRFLYRMLWTVMSKARLRLTLRAVRWVKKETAVRWVGKETAARWVKKETAAMPLGVRSSFAAPAGV